MNWVNNNIDLGQVKEKSVNKFQFEATDPTLKVYDIKPTCGGCTKILSYKDGILKVSFTAPKIPVHLTTRYWNYSAGVIITHFDGSKERLLFRSVIVK